MRLVALLFFAVSLPFLVFGAIGACGQQHKLVRYVPVEATVVAKRITTHTSSNSRGKSSVSYRPQIEYRYEAGGETYTCSDVTPVKVSASRSWAQEILDRYAVGARARAFHDPEDPSQAFLVREATFLPYLFVLFPLVFTCLAIVLWRRAAPHVYTRPRRDEAGAFQLLPLSGIARRRNTWILCAAPWWVAGTLAFAHYLWVSSGALDTACKVVFPIWLGLGLVPLAFAGRFAWLARLVGDAVVRVDQAAYMAGDPIAVEVEQPTHGRFPIDRVVVSLLGERTQRRNSGGRTQLVTETLHEASQTLAENTRAHAVASVGGSTVLTVPKDALPTTSWKANPRITWSLRVRSEIPNAPDYEASFPVRVGAR